MTRLSAENETLKAEVAALRARTDGSADEAVARAREQMMAALQTLDGLIGPKVHTPASLSASTASVSAVSASTPAAAASGCYGTTGKCCPPETEAEACCPPTNSSGCCPPTPARSCGGPSGPPTASTPNTATCPPARRPTPMASPEDERTPPRSMPSRDAPSRLGRMRDEECCGGLFDCDAMMRSAIEPGPRDSPHLP